MVDPASFCVNAGFRDIFVWTFCELRSHIEAVIAMATMVVGEIPVLHNPCSLLLKDAKNLRLLVASQKGIRR